MPLDMMWPSSPHRSREWSLSYKISPFFTYSICYWEVCKHFRVGDEFFVVFFFSGKFSWGRKFPGGELVRGNYTLEKFARISI